MKKIIFLVSHSYSGSSALYSAMNQHYKIQGYKRNNYSNSYINYSNLLDLTNYAHKLSNRSAIYMDELLEDRAFYANIAYEKCQFIYIIREPEIPLHFLITNEKKKAIFAYRNYTFRLRRICEMAKRTPGAVLLTWNNLVSGTGIDLISDYLGLKEPIVYSSDLLLPYKREFTSNLVGVKLLEEAKDTYEKYLYFLKNQKLLYNI